ncbi:MAG: hypothetical protein AAGF23_05105, partial [Acidobacteriota bacterium]
GGASPTPEPVRFTVGAPQAFGALGLASLIDFVDAQPQAHQPTPEPDPCVPCMAHELTQGSGSGGSGNLRSALLKSPFAASDAWVDLSTAELSLEELGLELLGIHLRFHDELRPLTAVAGDPATLESGAAQALVIEGFFSLPEVQSSQASLVFVLRDLQDPSARPFWSSSPLIAVAAALLPGVG